MKKKGFTGMAAALMFSLSVTNISSLAAVADNTGRWEKSAQTGEWSYRLGQGLVQNEWLLCQGKWYRFDANGKMLTGWYQDQETKIWYYLGTDGAMVTGWAAVNGRWYYMNANGQMLANQTTPDGYQVNADGAWVNEAGIPYSAPMQTGTTSGGSSSGSKSSGGSGSSSSGGSSSSSGGSSNSGTTGDNTSNGADNTDDNNNGGDNAGDNNNNGNGSNNGSNNGSSSDKGDKKDDGTVTPGEPDQPSNPEQPEETALVVESQTKLIDLGWSQYVTVAFAKGYSLDNCKILVDGVDVTSAFSKVDDEGTFVKWELTDLYPGSLSVVAEDGTTQVVRLSDNLAPTAPHVENKNTAPASFLAHGSVYVWDYHLTNYDEDGNVRVHPTKTTFSLGQKSNAIPFYSPDAELTEDESNFYGVGGQAVIMFNYTTEADKQWFDAISDVDLVADNGNNSTLNDNLNYEKKLADHNGNEVGQIVVPLGQSNFYSNGRYYLRIRSGGKSTLFPIHVVNGTAPSMKLAEAGSIKSGQNVHFKMENMTYGVTMPIYRVELTAPDGTTRELEKITDWYLIGDSFVLYNDVTAENGRDNIPDNGLYTLTIYADGFKNVSTTFQVGSMESSSADDDLYGIDMMSSATTGGGGSSSGDASDGGSDTMSADLLFDADLLANALLLDELGVDNEYASAIADRWLSDMSGYDAVLDSNGEFYSFIDYRNAVEEAKVAGRYLTFADYVKSGNAVTTPNRPYAVKEVMEDNLLGEIQTNGSYLGKEAPVLTLVNENGETLNEVKENSEVRFACADETYMELLMENAKIFVNGVSYQALSSEKYRVEGNQLIFDASVFNLGKNTFTVKMDGYKDNIANVNVAKTVADATLSIADDLKTGNEVEVTTADESGDFFRYINKVELTRPDGTVKTVLPDGQESVYEKVGYEVSGNVLTLGKDLFTEAGAYSLKIYAEYYEAQEISFNVKEDDSEIGGEDLEPAKLQKAEKDFFGDYSLTFGMGNDDWMNAITEISVNGKIYEKGFVYNNTSYSLSITDGRISLGGAEFTEDINEIVICAEGYKNLILKVQKDGTIVDEDSEIDELAPAVVKSAEKDFFGDYELIFGMGNDDWMNAITEVTVNGETYDLGYVWNNKSYSLAVTDGKIKLGNQGFTEDVNEIVICAEGYEDLTVSVNKDGSLADSDDNGDNGEIGDEDGKLEPAEVKSVEKSFFGGDYTLSFGMGNDDWMNAITEVTVNGDAYEQGMVWGDKHYSLALTDGNVKLGGESFNEDVNEVVICAEGYKDLTLWITKDGKLTEEPADAEEISTTETTVADAEEITSEDEIIADTSKNENQNEKTEDQEKEDSTDVTEDADVADDEIEDTDDEIFDDETVSDDRDDQSNQADDVEDTDPDQAKDSEESNDEENNADKADAVEVTEEDTKYGKEAETEIARESKETEEV
ncbi:hemoblobin-interacting domain-containing protein [Brotaphodocola sp.]|uniref:hemoblobin-interacting domain-containing protein n=1 Tax=Brotaphodocola sp. TaxID=3073577 RepID=UPI003D7D7045